MSPSYLLFFLSLFLRATLSCIQRGERHFVQVPILFLQRTMCGCVFMILAPSTFTGDLASSPLVARPDMPRQARSRSQSFSSAVFPLAECFPLLLLFFIFRSICHSGIHSFSIRHPGRSCMPRQSGPLAKAAQRDEREREKKKFRPAKRELE